MMSNTPRYAVVILYPVTMNNMALPEHNMHPIETIEQVDGPCNIKLVDLVDGSVISFETEDPSMVFATHIANSWEEGEDQVVFDLATNPWDSMTTYTDLETMLNHNETNAETAFQVVIFTKEYLKKTFCQIKETIHEEAKNKVNFLLLRNICLLSLCILGMAFYILTGFNNLSEIRNFYSKSKLMIMSI